MGRRVNISILGSYTSSEQENSLAYELGRGLAELGVNIISGGQKGVMFSLAKGVSEARSGGDRSSYLVGILPNKGFEEANEFVDIAIPVGTGYLQNSVVPLSGDIVIAIGGSAGTLTEISLAWQFKKPIALLGTGGWAGRLAGVQLDSRREDKLPHFTEVKDILKWITEQPCMSG